DDLVAIAWALDHLDLASVSVVAGRLERDAAAAAVSEVVGDAVPVTRSPEVRHGDELVAIGPLTNLAADPSLPERVRRLVVMGGPIERGEFNFTFDAAAAAPVPSWDWQRLPVLRA